MTADATEAAKPSPLPKGPARWLTILVVLVGVAISVGSFLMLRATEFARARADFDSLTRDRASLIQDELTATQDSAESVAAFFNSSLEVDRAEFRSFTSALLSSRSEILTVEWLPRVSAGDRDAFEARTRAEGLRDYRINDGERGAAPTRSQYFPLHFVEPATANDSALGLDHAMLPLRWNAMRVATDAGVPSAAGGFPAHGDGDPHAYTVGVFAPLYAQKRAPATPEQRRDELTGFIAVVFDLRDIVHRAEQRFPDHGVQLRIAPIGSVSAAVARAEERSALPAAYGLRAETVLELAGLKFRLSTTAGDDFLKRPNYTFAWSALIAGLVMTLLAPLQAQSLTRRIVRRQQLETERELLFNLSPDLLCIARPDGYFQHLNPAWEKTLGFPRAKLLKHPFLEFIHPDDIEPTLERQRRLNGGTVVTDFENRYRCQDGSWRWLSWRAVSSQDDQHIYAIARDVTEQKTMMEELTRARHFAEHIAEVIPSIIYIYDFDEKRTIFSNRELDSARDRANKDAHLFAGVTRTIHEDDMPRFRAHLDEVKKLRDGEAALIDYRLLDRDGPPRWFQSRAAVFERNPDGSVKRFIGAATDINERKRAEDALIENNARLAFVLSAANMGVWELNVETGAAIWTEPLARVLGMSPEQMPKTLEEFLTIVHPDDRDAVRQAIEDAIQRGSLYQLEFRQNLPDGSVRWLAGMAKFGQGAHASRLFGLAWDTTARREAEAERARLVEQVRQSQKLESLGALAGGIAHEFNNLLTAISGNARLALQELTEQADRVCLEEIMRSASRASDLVRRILAFSRDEQPAWQPVELTPIVHESIRLLEETLPANIRIKFESDRGLPPVVADPVQVQQAIMNLGINASTAMGELGGAINISLRMSCNDRRLRGVAPTFHGDACLCLSVEDTGPGIEPEIMRRIFEPFFTTKAPGEATGMGLAIVHGIMRRHGGAVFASSQPGFGAKFDLCFPIAEAAVAHAAVGGDAHRGQGEKILYVDDEEALVFLAVRMLKRMGFDAEGLVDARQALRDFAQNPLRWDAVITDLGMPAMSGFEFAKELRRIRPDLPIIITSGYVREEDAQRARAIGVQEIIPKPNTVEEMAQVIAERLAAGRASSPA